MAKKVQSGKGQVKKAATTAKPAVKAVKKAAPAAKAAPAKKEIKQKEAPAKKAAPAKAAPAKAVEAKVKAKPEKEAKKKEAVPAEKKEPHIHEEDIRHVLLKRRENLLKEILESRVRESDSLKREIGDIYDEASIERDRELSLLLGDRDRQKLIEIDEAIQRIESGEYGICESCGEKIAPGRLKAQPFTKLCINCKAEEERQEARRKKFEAEGVYRNLTYGEEEEG